MSLSELKERAQALAAELSGLEGIFSSVAREDVAFVGGGSLPDQKMPTWVVELQAQSLSDSEFAERLRTGDPAVVGRIQEAKLILDLRTVFPRQMGDLVQAIRSALVQG